MEPKPKLDLQKVGPDQDTPVSGPCGYHHDMVPGNPSLRPRRSCDQLGQRKKQPQRRTCRAAIRFGQVMLQAPALSVAFSRRDTSNGSAREGSKREGGEGQGGRPACCADPRQNCKNGRSSYLTREPLKRGQGVYSNTISTWSHGT